jgi:hypothetical protein
MPASSLPVLRPLGVGELLDQAIRLYRRNFLSFIGIIAVVQIPIGLLQLLFSLLSVQSASTAIDFSRRAQPTDLFTPAYFAGQAGTLVVALISFVLVQGVATAAMTRAVADNYLGQPTGFGAAYRRIGQSWLPLVGTLFLAGLLAIALFIWFLVPCVGWATGLGILAFYGAVILPIIAPIVVLERKSGYRAVRRGWDLARRRFWAVLGFVVLLFLFNLIVVSGPNLLIGAIFQGLLLGAVRSGNSAAGLITAQLIVQSLLTLVASLLYLPLQLIGFTLVYLDLRVRTEGLDLAMLTQDAAGQEAPASAAASPTFDAVLNSTAPQSESGGLITARELGNFFFISLGFGAIYAVLVGGVVLIGALAATATR